MLSRIAMFIWLLVYSLPCDYDYYIVSIIIITIVIVVVVVITVIGSSGHSPRTGGLVKQKSNPLLVMGQGMKAGINTLYGVPQQAVGHMMGGAGSGHHLHHYKNYTQQQEVTAGSSPSEGAAANSPHRSRRARRQRPQERRQRAAAAKEQHQAEAQRSTSEHGASSLQQTGAGWDKVRKAVRGSATPVKSTKDSITAALESKSPPPEGNPQTRQLKHSESSSGSMSKNTTGPLQYIYSRGGKVAALLAMMGRTGKQEESVSEAESALDVAQPGHRDPCDITSPGPENHPGEDPISKFGASQPQAAAGSQVFCLPHWLMCLLVHCVCQGARMQRLSPK